MLLSRAMQTSDFDYHLPEDLIAQYPLSERTASRLLHVGTGHSADLVFSNILELLNPGDLLVFNNTRVIPARLHGQKQTGGKVEVLVERIIDEHRVLAHVRASKSPKQGSKLTLESRLEVEMLGRQGELFELKFLSTDNVINLLEEYGHMPLPPYIERADEKATSSATRLFMPNIPGLLPRPPPDCISMTNYCKQSKTKASSLPMSHYMWAQVLFSQCDARKLKIIICTLNISMSMIKLLSKSLKHTNRAGE